MKREIRIIVLLALFVSVVVGSVAFGGVKSNADTKAIPAGYVAEGLAHFYDVNGQSSGPTLVDYKGTADGLTYGTASIDSDGLHITKGGSAYANAATDMFKGDFTAEFYIQDFKRGSDTHSYIFTVGKEGVGAYFHVGVWHDRDRFIIKKDKTEHNLDFMNATSNLQDALVSIVYDKAHTTMKFYLNGALLKSIDSSTISAISSDADYVQIGDNSGYWATETFKSIRFYSQALTSAQIRTNYEADYLKYNKEHLADIPSWRDYKINNNLKGYFAGQNPLITDYYKIINGGTNTDQISSYSYTGLTTEEITEISNFITEQKKNFTVRLYNRVWQNQADLTHSTAVWDDLDILSISAQKKILSYSASYLDRDGYHFNDFPRNVMFGNADFVDATATNRNSYVGNILQSSTGFTIEMFIGDFDAHLGNTNNDSIFFSFGNGESEFCLYYDNGKTNPNNNQQHKLAVKCIGSLSGNNAVTLPEAQRPYVWKSPDELKDTLISVVYYRNDSDRYVRLYIDGTLVSSITTQTSGITLPNASDWKDLYLGSSSNNRDTSLTYRCIRVYDIPLTDAQIVANYNRDVILYKNAPSKAYKVPDKQTTSYGLCGFDKILENNSFGVGREIKFTQDNITNENGNNGYVNELLNDWEPATGLYITKTERLKYFIASLNNGKSKSESTLTYKRAPVRLDQRATFYDFSTFMENMSKSFRGRSESGALRIVESGMEKYGDVTTNLAGQITKVDWYDNYGALVIQNSFYMRSKYKCGDSSVTVEDGKITDSTKLMVTADIDPVSLRDTNFCGMVIDFSDDIWNRYDPNMDYSGYEWTGHARDDSMYTHYDNDAGTGDGYCRTSLFETGVGFNLVRTSGSEEGDNTGYKMRVFVGGDGSQNSTAYIDIQIPNIQTLLNYTIYREYTTWPFADITLSNGTSSWNLQKGTNVYLVKFYVNKKMVAVVVMGLGNASSIKTGEKPTAGEMGYIIPIVNGAPVAKDAVKTYTFKNWRNTCNYGYDGNHVNNGNDLNTASASGNILFAVNRKNNLFTYATNTDGSSDGYQMNATDEDLCRVVIDNIGYMDYHDTNTHQTYKGNYVVNQDMTFNLKSDLVFARKVFEPKIYFNRLAYDSSDLLYSELTAFNSLIKDNFENGRAKGNFEWNGTTFTKEDYNAAHNMAVIDNGSFLAGDTSSKITQYKNSINGVFFKDIADYITYDLVDFNGETMFVKQYRAYDYFEGLREYWINNKIEENGQYNAPNLTQAQCKFLCDLVMFCKACTEYDRYNEKVGYTIDALKRVSIGNKVVFRETFDGDITDDIYINKTIAEKYGKPKMKRVGTSTYSFNNYNIVVKNYIGLVTQINVPEGTTIDTIKEKLHIYEAQFDKTNNVWIKTNNEITSWKDPVKTSYNKETFDYIKLDDTGVITIEVPLKLSEMNKVFVFVLGDETNYQEMTYGIYNYCVAKWETTNTRLQFLVKRLLALTYRAGNLNQSQIVMEDL